MMIVAAALIGVVLIALMFLCFSCLAVAQRADAQADAIWRGAITDRRCVERRTRRVIWIGHERRSGTDRRQRLEPAFGATAEFSVA